MVHESYYFNKYYLILQNFFIIGDFANSVKDQFQLARKNIKEVNKYLYKFNTHDIKTKSDAFKKRYFRW